jgi:hypothetical protein
LQFQACAAQGRVHGQAQAVVFVVLADGHGVRVPDSKVTPSSTAVAAIWVMRRMISCSSPGKARPRMSMSRVTRRAPNWASWSPPLKDEGLPAERVDADAVEEAFEQVIEHYLVGGCARAPGEVAQVVVNAAGGGVLRRP